MSIFAVRGIPKKGAMGKIPRVVDGDFHGVGCFPELNR